MTKIYNLEKAINYTAIFKLLNFNWRKFWAFYSKIEKYIFIDTPITEYSKELCPLLQSAPQELEKVFSETRELFSKVTFQYNVLTIKDSDYSEHLKNSLEAPAILFIRGNADLMKYPAVSVVGTRQASDEGKGRARKLSLLLADMGFVITSGLAKGIDAAAHTGAIAAGGHTIAVIGTNLSESYPAENRSLQETIATDHLLISQFPFGCPTLPYNFPLRNQTMSGLSLATIIVEAGETSGALIQAKQCLRQKRKLFILKNLIDNSKLEWPKAYVNKENVYVVSKIDDLVGELQKFTLVREPKSISDDSNYDLFGND